MKKEQRTSQQNKALYKFFEMVAEALNDAGFDVKKALRNATIDIPWTKERVKTIMWHTLQREMYGTSSTTKLTKQEQIDRIHEVLNKFLGELGIDYIEFPHQCEECGRMDVHDKDCSKWLN